MRYTPLGGWIIAATLIADAVIAVIVMPASTVVAVLALACAVLAGIHAWIAFRLHEDGRTVPLRRRPTPPTDQNRD